MEQFSYPGIQLWKKPLSQDRTKTTSTECVLEAVEICLKHNNSQFGDENYLQIHERAIYGAPKRL